MEVPWDLKNPVKNNIENYECGCNIKSYLNQCLERSGKNIDQLMLESGYRRKEKFISHRKLWHELKKPVPGSYLRAIGVDLKVLDYVISLDQQNYAQVLERKRYPTCFRIKIIPAIYRTIEFENIISEEQAIELVKNYARETKKDCFIEYPDLISILISPDDNTRKVYFQPAINIRKNL